MRAGAYLNHSFTLKQCLGWWAGSLALLLLGAHFFRGGDYGLSLCALGLLLFNCGFSAWKNFAVAFFLWWGALEWGRTACELALFRSHLGQPWLRGFLILSFVASFSAFSGFYAYCRAGALVSPDERHYLFKAMIFMLVFLSLLLIRSQAGPGLLLLERYFPWGSAQLFFAAWYAAFIGGLLLDSDKKGRARRKIWLAFGCVFFAQLILGLAGFEKMLMSGRLHLPVPAFIVLAPVYRGEISLFMPLLLLVSVLLAGGVWCSFLCYFGCFNAAVGTAVSNGQSVPKWLAFGFKCGRPSVLLAGVSGALILRLAGAGIGVSLAAAALFAAVGLWLLFGVSKKYGGLVHCTAFCPLGFIVSILAPLSPWRIKVDAASCDGCGACEKACAYRAIDASSRKKGGSNSRCSMCRDCLNVCRKKAISVWNPLIPARFRLPALVAVSTVLHVLFLNLARV